MLFVRSCPRLIHEVSLDGPPPHQRRQGRTDRQRHAQRILRAPDVVGDALQRAVIAHDRQQVGQAGRASPKQAALLKRSRLTKARARNVLRATQDAYPEQVLGGDYSSQSKVYQLDLLGLIDDRKRGASPYLLTPQQVEMALSYYVFLLAHNLPFLDIQTLRITEADAFYQWVVPDVARELLW